MSIGSAVMSWFGIENGLKSEVALLGVASGVADEDLTNALLARKGLEIVKSSPVNKAGITALLLKV